jgi:hypothetical protein
MPAAGDNAYRLLRAAVVGGRALSAAHFFCPVDPMKSLLGKIAIRKVVGLYLGEHEVAVSKVASTPLGPVVIASSSEPCTPENTDEVIERLLAPMIGTKHRAAVAVGLPVSRVFFGTRLTPTGAEARPEVELQKTLCSSNLSADDLIVDLLRDTINKTRVARIAACRTKYLSHLIATLNRLGVRPIRTEPAPCAILRLAEAQHAAPRRSKTLLRIILGTHQGLAVLVAGDFPLAWRPFSITDGMESFGILSAARGLTTQQRHYGIEATLDYAILHGRGDLHEKLLQEQLPTEMGTRVIWHEGPALDGAATAHGLALGCLASDLKAFDLSRSVKARAPIKEIMPWKEAAFAASLVAGMGGVLGAHAMQLHESYVAVKAENTQHICLGSGDLGNLEKEKKSLEEKVKAVAGFVGSRMLWSTYTSEIAHRLPAHALLTSFNGKNILNYGAKNKSPGAFQLRGVAPLSKQGAVPDEIDAFLRAVPQEPLWKRDFDSVVTDIRLPLSAKAVQPNVEFAIIGRCKDNTSAALAKGGSEKPARKKPT